MNTDLLIVALLAGLANYAFRVLPTRMGSTSLPQTGPLARFLAATGPAAIATLFVASILPSLSLVPRDMATLAIGTASVIGVYLASRSVVAATLAGSVAYGVSVFALG
ncbi:AzlD domain-containing protein [Tabrizicola sp. BL-A-41-H6]|uniref:AzlD domain-containing protein n=1 Tax=Tabrizicola sp. BL-A-41-H6 TaxID=3421107 RepID=UPI003D67EBE6